MNPTLTADTVRVPFLDLAPSHAAVREAILGDVAALLDSGAFTNGPEVRELEQAFARYCSSDECIGLASGLDALRLALVAAGIEPGDEVVVPANTFIATWEAVSQAGATPVPVDVTEADYNLDVAATVSALTPRTRFIMPVHLYGQLADMRGLLEVAARHDVRIVEDACQAHGATRDGVKAGAAGLAGAFSFYPGKNLGAIGDAGALVTNDAGLADTVRALREHGQREKYRHEWAGYTARLDTIQAIALLHKLPLLDGWNDERRAIAAQYDSGLSGIGDLVLPPVPPGSDPVWHLYPIRTAAPLELAEFLRERGIGTGRHYPEPPHLSAAYAALGRREGEFPVAEAIAREVLSLPVFPGMRDAQVAAVVESVRAYFTRGR